MSLSLIVDLVIIITLILYGFDGFRRGFVLLTLELTGSVVAFYLSLLYAGPMGSLLNHYFNLSSTLQKPVGFLVLWVIIQAFYVLVSSMGYQVIPKAVRESIINRIGGLIPSLAKGVVMIAIFLTLIVALPFDNTVRSAISHSYLGKPFITESQKAQQYLLRRYSKDLNDTLTFFTSSPFAPKTLNKDEAVALNFKTTQVTVDTESEKQLLALVNSERRKAGLNALQPRADLQAVARSHARDMFARGYFAHNTPEGQDPFERMKAAGITFLAAGENLALAPTVELAHSGLMNSPEHRENILYPDYGHLGVGVIDAGLYGKMFVQEFSD